MFDRRILAIIIMLLVALTLFPDSAVAQGNNPFTGSEAFDGAVPRGPIGSFLGRVQIQLQDAMGRLLRALQGEGDAGVIPAVVGLSILYGVVHALLPGHRKTLLFSYFLSNDARPIHAVVAGGLLGVLHAFAAIVLIVGGYYLLELSLSGAIAEVDLFMQRLSAVLILVVGGVLLLLKIRELIHETTHKHEHIVEALKPVSKELDPDGLDPSRQHLYEHSKELSRRHRKTARGLPAIIASGIIPCPGSALVLLFSLSVGVLWAGVIAVTSISIGMALSLTLLSLATIFLKDRIVRFFHGHLGHLVHAGVELLGAVVMLSFGVFLVLGLW
ncbi:MAG: nickel/cobalt transporter [Spirochaetaceae bacterium]